MRLAAHHPDSDVEVSVYAFRNILSSRQNARDDEMAHCHGNGTPDQKASSTGLVDVEKDHGSENNEERVLDTGRDQEDITLETVTLLDDPKVDWRHQFKYVLCHGKNIDHIVSHNVGTTQLLPCLHAEPGKRALPHSILYELSPTRCR